MFHAAHVLDSLILQKSTNLGSGLLKRHRPQNHLPIVSIPYVAMEKNGQGTFSLEKNHPSPLADNVLRKSHLALASSARRLAQ